MKQNSFSILEFRSIYSIKDNIMMGLDLNNNLVVPRNVFDEIKQFILKTVSKHSF